MEYWFQLYLNFLTCFSVSSFICFIIDINSDIIKYNEKKIIQFKDQSTSIDLIKKQYNYIYPRVLVNVLLISPIFFKMLVNNYNLNNNFSLSDLLYIFLAGCLIDIFFYTSHRIMHHPVLYKWSHKIHHNFKTPVGMESVYHHWFDLCFANILPIFLSLWILQVRSIQIWHIWVSLSTFFTVFIAHSGWIRDTHNDHHQLYNKHFGTGVFMDKLFDTGDV